MGRPVETCALGMLEWLPQNPECERLALEFGVMLSHAMIADRGYAATRDENDSAAGEDAL